MTDRTPYCHKIRYGITGAPILTEDEMDGSYAPGVGAAPTLIELVYHAARDGKPASVSASVTGDWTRFGKRDGGQVTTHFKNDPDGWPAWLATEARLHDPAAASVGPAPATDRAALVEIVAQAIRDSNGSPEALEWWRTHPQLIPAHVYAAAVLAVLPAPGHQTAALSDAERAMLTYALDQAQEAIWSQDGFTDEDQAAVTSLRRLAGETQQDRCPSCDHKAEYHDVDNRCWFTVDHGVAGSNLVCPCAPRRDDSETQQDEDVAVSDVQHMLTRMRATAAQHSLDELLRLIAVWAVSSEGRDVLVEDLVAAGYRLPHACGNCEGVDPATCLASPAREARQDPAPGGETKPARMDAWHILGIATAPDHCTGAVGFCAEHGVHRPAPAQSGQPDTNQETRRG